MQLAVRPYGPDDLTQCAAIWNQVVEDGVAFPGEDRLSDAEMADLLAQQDAVSCAVDADDRVLGFYILHPNNIGRCSHTANASYCVAAGARGLGVGKLLVPASLREARELGFRGMQFNAVVKGNVHAIKLYQDNGFAIIGTIPGGFRLKDGSYSDMYVMHRSVLDI